MHNGQIKRQVLTVSQLTGSIKSILEEKFSFIWIHGEISNFSRSANGHCYFTLKDKNAQISGVIFRGQAGKLKFDLENGMAVTGFGRVSVYEPRGNYQFIFEYLEPVGVGNLQLAFEQLKMRLKGEGLFENIHKKPLPPLPRRISVITSPTGSVIHDIINVMTRRFPNVHLEVVPVQVQGDASVDDICTAFSLVNRLGKSDVIILARGGGSLEDMQSFNSEPVARSIFTSNIPVVSAVGHETDFTIADFVSDLRAPTPSAAAEVVVPDKHELELALAQKKNRLVYSINHQVTIRRLKISQVTRMLKDPRRQLEDMRLRVDDFRMRLEREFIKCVSRKKERLVSGNRMLLNASPLSRVHTERLRLSRLMDHMRTMTTATLNNRKSRHIQLAGKLDSLSPVSVLQRGYSITRVLPGKKIVTDSKKVKMNQNLEIFFHKGKVTANVTEITGEGITGEKE